MIIKSMSRKEASFGQLMDYIDRDGGEERFRIRYNLLGRDRERIREEFETNAERMAKRKNGVFMYHEIISLTRARGISIEAQKERLHQIAQEYMAARAPHNLCYGGLHDDKDHSLHYHLIISANKAGEEKRHRLSKQQFRTIQVALERHVRETYPELEQKIAIERTADTPLPKKEAEMKRRGGRTTRREEVAGRLQEALTNSRDRESLFAELSSSGLELYVRGKNIGVIDHETGKRHRIKTLSPELVSGLTERMETVEQVREKPEAETGRSRAEEKFASAGEKENERGKPEKTSSDDTPSTAQSQEKDENMERRRGDPIPPDAERQEFIDKGHVCPDPERDLMSHEDWRKQDHFTTKVQQSIRRTRDDFEGRTEELGERAKEAPLQQRWRQEEEQRRQEAEKERERQRGEDDERQR